jgi:hypothetical protein
MCYSASYVHNKSIYAIVVPLSLIVMALGCFQFHTDVGAGVLHLRLGFVLNTESTENRYFVTAT